MTLFTKENCAKCDFVKKHVDLESRGVAVEVLGPENSGALAHLAWHGLVRVAEKQLPLLVLDDCSFIAGAIPIKGYFEGTTH